MAIVILKQSYKTLRKLFIYLFIYGHLQECIFLYYEYWRETWNGYTLKKRYQP